MPKLLYFGLTACLICNICVIKIYIFEAINIAIKSPSSIWTLSFHRFGFFIHFPNLFLLTVLLALSSIWTFNCVL